MTRIKKIGCWFVFVALCLGLFFGTASLTTRAFAQVQHIIGVSVPTDDSYEEIFDDFQQTYIDYTWIVDEFERDNTTKQMEGIDELISFGIDVIIVAPSSADALSSVVQKIDGTGIGLFVLGDYVPGCPEGTVFIDLDTYYECGVNHADWVCGNATMSGNASIRIFYHDAWNGRAYLAGMLDRLEELNFPGTIRAESIDTSQDLEDALDIWIGQGKDDLLAVNEVVTHSSAIAEEVLQRYYQEGYTDAPFGIGIRAFSTPSGGVQARFVRDDLGQVLDAGCEAYLSDVTQTSGNALAEYLNGEEISSALVIDGCYVLSCGFVPGYARYVSL